MSVAVASRQLRNETAKVLEQVAAGARVIITVRGKPVADLVPHRPEQARWLAPDEVVAIATDSSADAGLRWDLEQLAGETTDDLGPIQ